MLIRKAICLLTIFLTCHGCSQGVDDKSVQEIRGFFEKGCNSLVSGKGSIEYTYSLINNKGASKKEIQNNIREYPFVNMTRIAQEIIDYSFLFQGGKTILVKEKEFAKGANLPETFIMPEESIYYDGTKYVRLMQHFSSTKKNLRPQVVVRLASFGAPEEKSPLWFVTDYLTLLFEHKSNDVTSIETVEFNGRHCQRIEFKVDDYEIAFWLDEKMSYRIIKIEINNRKTKQYSSVVHIKYRIIDTVPFPEKIEQLLITQHDRMMQNHRELLFGNDWSINISIPDSTFMSFIPANALVMDPQNLL
jgi:hypothetical protein